MHCITENKDNIQIISFPVILTFRYTFFNIQMKHLPSCSDITACIDFCRDLHSLQTERIHGQALALTPCIWDDSLETVVPLSQSLLKSSHLWVASKMNSGWRFLISVNPKCQKPPPVLRVENTQPSLIHFCCNRRQFLIPVASSSDAGICPQSVPAPTYTFGLAELHARDAFPPPLPGNTLLILHLWN